MPLIEAQRDAIEAAARSYVGVPWVGQGRDHRGIDCVGVWENAYIEGGMPLERTPATYRGIDSKLLVAVLAKHFRPISHELARHGDLLIYRLFAEREAHMAGLVRAGRKEWAFNTIHCPGNYKVVETRFDPTVGDIKGFYTWR